MRKGTVTGEVKMIVKELGLKWLHAYSDNYTENRVGVKLVGTYLTDDQKQIVKQKMIDKGFGFRYIRENDNGWMGHCNGTRFCFQNKI
jgi:hypothetical protein